MSQLTVGGTSPGEVGLGSVRKQAEGHRKQAKKQQPSMVPALVPVPKFLP